MDEILSKRTATLNVSQAFPVGLTSLVARTALFSRTQAFSFACHPTGPFGVSIAMEQSFKASHAENTPLLSDIKQKIAPLKKPGYGDLGLIWSRAAQERSRLASLRAAYFYLNNYFVKFYKNIDI